MMRGSACCLVRPRVMSLVSCKFAILPMAASWISSASLVLASSAGMAWTSASSIRMASQAEWPRDLLLPMMVALKVCLEKSRAMEREARSAVESLPFSSIL